MRPRLVTGSADQAWLKAKREDPDNPSSTRARDLLTLERGYTPKALPQTKPSSSRSPPPTTATRSGSSPPSEPRPSTPFSDWPDDLRRRQKRLSRG